MGIFLNILSRSLSQYMSEESIHLCYEMLRSYDSKQKVAMIVKPKIPRASLLVILVAPNSLVFNKFGNHMNP
jgi:hypothetical protein